MAGMTADKSETEDASRRAIKLYARRWLVLAIYALYTCLVASQYVQYSVISNVVTRYYSVSPVAVNCTSLIFSLCYLLLVFPLTYASERIGLQRTLLLGSAVCCAGAWIKLLSAKRDGFAYTMVGQCLIASSVVILQMPNRMAANWFGADEQSTATSLGMVGPQLGAALSFFLPPILVKNHDNVDEVGAELALMFWCGAIAFSLSLALAILFVRHEPELPPSEKRALQLWNRLENKATYGESMRKMIANKRFLVHCHCFGLNACVLAVLDTMLNQLIALHFENAELDAGRIGVVNLTTGMLGSAAFGFVLDRAKSHQRAVTLLLQLLYLAALCVQAMFSAAMFAQLKWLLYVYALFVGFLSSGCIVLGYKLAADYTYPESEANSAAILMTHAQIYSFLAVLVCGQLFKYLGDVPVHALLCCNLAVGFVATCLASRGKVEYREVATRVDNEAAVGEER